jgi:hypothetical protein
VFLLIVVIGPKEDQPAEDVWGASATPAPREFGVWRKAPRARSAPSDFFRDFDAVSLDSLSFACFHCHHGLSTRGAHRAQKQLS